MERMDQWFPYDTSPSCLAIWHDMRICDIAGKPDLLLLTPDSDLAVQQETSKDALAQVEDPCSSRGALG